MRPFVAAIVTAGIALGAAGVAHADIAVEVSLSEKLQKRVARIDAIEQRREEDFRRHGTDDRNVVRSSRRFIRSELPGVQWAGELLIADAADYGVENLLVALVKENMRRAGKDGFDDTIRVTLNRLGVANHSLSVLRSASDYAVGTFEIVDSASGAVKQTAEVRTSLGIGFEVNPHYDGPDFAFADTDPSRRVGPVLTDFVQEGLEELFPGEAFAGPVVVIHSRTSGRALENRLANPVAPASF